MRKLGLNTQDRMVLINRLKRDEKSSRPTPTTQEEYKKLERGQSYITKKGKLSWKRTPKERFLDGLFLVISWIIRPFYVVGSFLRNIIYNLLWPKTNFHHNGVFGPGGHTSYDQYFSWGRLSFVIVVGFIIIYFIFLR